MSPKVSILVPTYNGAEYLVACLDSALSQSFGDFELIVCDDGSRDKTVSSMRASIGPRDPGGHHSTEQRLWSVVTRSDEEIAEHIRRKEKFYHSRLGQFRAKLGQAIEGVKTSRGNSKASAGSAVTFPVKPPPKWIYMPNEDAVKRFKNRTSIDISKAGALIGYQPNFDLKRGMHYTRLWAAWANLL